MNTMHPFVAAVIVILGTQMASAQDLSRYRAYALESSVEAIVAASGARVTDVRTLHERPARIQELRWRAPYASQTDSAVDPVRGIAFTFYNDALYQVVVTYDRDRTAGLTNGDIIEALSAAYGEPSLARRPRAVSPAETFPDDIDIARWEDAESRLTLLRGAYTPEVQVILVSRSLSMRAQAAIREAMRLDVIEGPRREAERRKREVDDAKAARDKMRTANKAAFRP